MQDIIVKVADVVVVVEPGTAQCANKSRAQRKLTYAHKYIHIHSYVRIGRVESSRYFSSRSNNARMRRSARSARLLSRLHEVTGLTSTRAFVCKHRPRAIKHTQNYTQNMPLVRSCVWCVFVCVCGLCERALRELVFSTNILVYSVVHHTHRHTFVLHGNALTHARTAAATYREPPILMVYVI